MYESVSVDDGIFDVASMGYVIFWFFLSVYFPLETHEIWVGLETGIYK